MKISVTAKPGAKKTQIQQISATEIVAHLHAPAHEGRANEELVRALALFFHVSKSRVVLTQGARGKRKVIEIL